MGAAEPLHAPSAARNQAPILAVLRRVLPAPVEPRRTVLEIASGTGQHAAAFAAALPDFDWQPSDPDPQARASIAAWRAKLGPDVANLRPPLDLDVLRPAWEDAMGEAPVAILCINMIHIAPWAACEGLMRGAGALLNPGGLLMLYGPYRRGGHHTAPSNEAFDRSLRAQDPAWGVRDLEAVAACAASRGIVLEDTVAMPANNLSLVLRRKGSSGGGARSLEA